MAIRISKKETKEGKKYFYDVYYDKKRYRSKLFSTKSEAKKAERDFLERLEKGLSSNDYTFNDVIDKYIAHKKRVWKKSTEETTVDILNHIRYKLGKIKVRELTTKQYEAFLDYIDNLSTVSKHSGKLIKKPYSVRYKNRVLMYVKSVCDYAKKHLRVSTDIPWMYDNWKDNSQKKMQVLTVAEFDSFLQYVSGDYKSFFTFLFYTGCRRGEALALTFEDVDFQSRTIRINKSFSKVENKPVSTKTKSSIRTIPVSSKAFQAVEEMYSKYHKGYIFGGKKPLGFSSIERHKNRALDKAGLPRIRVHDLRHSFITMMINKGADIATVSRYVGHSSIKQTLDTYTHYYENKMKEVINIL